MTIAGGSEHQDRFGDQASRYDSLVTQELEKWWESACSDSAINADDDGDPDTLDKREYTTYYQRESS